MFELPALPYARDALAPHISPETLDYHHGKHHAAYVKKLNELVAGTPWAERPLADIVRSTEPGPLFDNAAQHWNHSFYWRCLGPPRGREPSATLANDLRRTFGTFDAFRDQFSSAATGIFGSGWAWLVRYPDGGLAIETTSNAETPLRRQGRVLLTCDMWEHAFYIDYRNDDTRYLRAFWHVVDWEFVTSCDR